MLKWFNLNKFDLVYPILFSPLVFLSLYVTAVKNALNLSQLTYYSIEIVLGLMSITIPLLYKNFSQLFIGWILGCFVSALLAFTFIHKNEAISYSYIEVGITYTVIMKSIYFLPAQFLVHCISRIYSFNILKTTQR
ncbi:MAG: hypothetical protein K0S51_2100 [Bacillales bacterium]|jgi:hypothetical protein|nr:hypothetical protein [Bacillales bacterium]